MAERPEQNVNAELSRDLGLFHVTMMGLGMMIGAGVFVGIGLCMHTAGPGGLMITFAANGLIALLSAMSFAELASAIPRAGGTYNFARIGFGRPASFLAGWMEWMAAAAAGGFYAVVLATYTLEYFAELGWLPGPVDNIWIRLFAVAAVLAFVYINFRGSSETGKLGAIFTVGQMLFVIGIGVAGAIQFLREPSRVENFQPFLGDGSWIKLLGSMGIIYVAFEGFEVIAQAGDETVAPRRNIPKAILLSVAIVTITYLLVAFGTIVAVNKSNPALEGLPVWEWISIQGPNHEGTLGFRGAVDMLMGGWGGLLVTLAVICSATSALNATIYSATRSSFALGRDRMMPAAFSKIHPRTKTPYVALAVTAFLVLGVAVSLDPKDGGATASVMFLVLFFLVNLCVIRIRRHMGDELQYGFLMPLFPLFPILAILLQLGLAFGILEESPLAIKIVCVWLLLGAAVYFFYGRRRAVMTEDEIHIFEEQPVSSDAGYNVTVALANPESALELVQTTNRICQSKPDAHIELIHMVPVPSQVPLSSAEKYMSRGREAILETMLYLGLQFPVGMTIRYCRNCARGILSAVRQKKADLLIMGWHGRGGKRHFTLGSTVDPILERAACNVLMLKHCGGNKKFNRILVPVAGGPNGELAIQTAAELLEDGGVITALTVNHGGRKGFDPEAFIAEQRETLNLGEETLQGLNIDAANVIDAILEQARKNDLLILGSTAESRLRQMTHLAIPEAIARQYDQPMIMVRANTGLQSFFKRWL